MTENNSLAECWCPLVEFPCPRGEEVAHNCQVKVAASFDPIASFADYFILECARELAAKHAKHLMTDND